MRRDIRGELTVALVAVVMLVFALVFAALLTLTPNSDDSGLTKTPALVAESNAGDSDVLTFTETISIPLLTPTNTEIILSETPLPTITRRARLATPVLPAETQVVLAAFPTNTPTALPSKTPTIVISPTETPTITPTILANTLIPPTDTALPPTIAIVETAIPPTHTLTHTPIPTIASSPTLTFTSVPPTLTSTSTPTSTYTSTVLPTPIPPTATKTFTPTVTRTPSQTPLPPTPTSGIISGPIPGQIGAVSNDCQQPPNWTTYTVRNGDTLFAIARSVNSSVGELRAVNCIKGSENIVEGSMVFLPRSPNTPIVTSTPSIPPETALPIGCANAGVQIIGPLPLQQLNGLFLITGTANIGNFWYYKIELRADGSPYYDLYLSSQTAVINSVLGEINADSYENGFYWIRLSAVDITGGIPASAFCEIPIVIAD